MPIHTVRRYRRLGLLPGCVGSRTPRSTSLATRLESVDRGTDRRRAPLPCLVVYGNRRKARWAAYAPQRRVRKPSQATLGRVRKSAKSAHDKGPVRPKSVHDLQTGPCLGRESARVAGGATLGDRAGERGPPRHRFACARPRETTARPYFVTHAARDAS